MSQLADIEKRIEGLREAKASVASRIQKLEEFTEVINLELEKALIKKGEVSVKQQMKEYFKDEL